MRSFWNSVREHLGFRDRENATAHPDDTNASMFPAEVSRRSDIRSYSEMFESCVVFARDRQLGRQVGPLGRNALSIEHLKRGVLEGLRSSGASAHHMSGAAGQCLKFAHYFAPFVARATGIAAWPTLGQLWYGEKIVFGPTWRELDAWLRRGVSQDDLVRDGRNGVPWHAWITMESGDLVDVTFAATMARVFPSLKSNQGTQILLGPEPDVIRGHRFVPMLAGREAIERLQEKTTFRFLAETLDDLSHPDHLLVITPLEREGG